MSYSTFTDRVNKPSEEDVVQLIGNKFKQWTEIDSYMVNMIKAKSSYKFYGKNYGWALGYSKNNKSIISLYPLSNDFTIQMIFKKEHEVEIIKNIDNNELLDLIKNTSEIHEGKWIFIKYSKINSSAIVKKMINIKLKSK
jgi:hypothetical protein